jgi:hypothetical protein
MEDEAILHAPVRPAGCCDGVAQLPQGFVGLKLLAEAVVEAERWRLECCQVRFLVVG